jgi:hypothetical protein
MVHSYRLQRKMKAALTNGGDLHNKVLPLQSRLLHKWNKAETLINVETQVLCDMEESHRGITHSESRGAPEAPPKKHAGGL